MRYKYFFVLAIFLSNLFAVMVQAGEGALSLTTEPREANIYVDGKMKASATPIVLKLSAGWHNIEAKQGDKSVTARVFIGDDALVVKKLVLGGAPVIATENIEDMLFPEQDVFETYSEFQARRKKLLQDFNYGAEQQDPRFRAGTATLDRSGYDIKSGKFPIRIKWQDWTKKLNFFSNFYIIVNRDKARALWQEGKEKAVFVNVKNIVTNKAKMIGLGKTWNIEILLKPGETFQDRLKNGGLAPEMVVIPVGSFQMGSNNGDSDEKPVHQVNINYQFAAGKYEVTVGEFRQFVNATNYRTDAEKGDGCYVYDGSWSEKDDSNWRNPYFSQTNNQPVVCISWNDAVAYTKWLSKQTAKEYRLPSEAEWEYVARAGSTTKYWWGNSIGNNRANCDGCGSRWDDKSTSPVGSFQANQFGLYDTVGNVWEWCADKLHSNYENAPTDGSAWDYATSNNKRVLRGVSWYDNPGVTRAAVRSWGNQDLSYNVFGFRVVLVVRTN
ncbi:MAG: formylglycine-generating enzyme family protein [Thiomargarita sp.]|nr:formylglycine-generating enzyme family protein [Thiomargarita sp.]